MRWASFVLVFGLARADSLSDMKWAAERISFRDTPEQVEQITAALGKPNLDFAWCNDAGCVERGDREVGSTLMRAYWHGKGAAGDDMVFAVRFCGRSGHWRVCGQMGSISIASFPQKGGAWGTQPKMERLYWSGAEQRGLPLDAVPAPAASTSSPPAAQTSGFKPERPPKKPWLDGLDQKYMADCVKTLQAKYGAKRTPAQVQYACECITWNLEDRYSFGEMYDAAKSNAKAVQDAVVEISALCKKSRPAELGADPD